MLYIPLPPAVLLRNSNCSSIVSSRYAVRTAPPCRIHHTSVSCPLLRIIIATVSGFEPIRCAIALSDIPLACISHTASWLYLFFPSMQLAQNVCPVSVSPTYAPCILLPHLLQIRTVSLSGQCRTGFLRRSFQLPPCCSVSNLSRCSDRPHEIRTVHCLQ